MEKILYQKHSRFTFIYAFSKLLERAAYYGLRAAVVLYMTSETLKMSYEDALTTYGWFTSLYFFSQILGGLIGDLVIGNKKSIILGGILQALGAFSFCIPSMAGLYLGITLVVIGGGLYSPNLAAHFGKLYLNKTKLLDAGFSILYLAINVGAFIGAFAISHVATTINWNIGFVLAGLLMILSIGFPLAVNELGNTPETPHTNHFNQRVFKVLFACILVGFFWVIYEITMIKLLDLQMDFSNYSTLNIPQSFWSGFESFFLIPLGVVAIVAWSYFYNSQFVKLTIGFVFGAVSFGLLFFIPEIPADQHLILFAISTLFLSIAEIHIAPVIHSVLTQYGNPKYLAILISLSIVPMSFFSGITVFFSDFIYYPAPALILGTIAMGATSVGLLIYIKNNNK